MEANRFSIYHNKALTQRSNLSVRLSASKNYFQLILVLFLHGRSKIWPKRSTPKSTNKESLARALGAALAQGVSVVEGPLSQGAPGVWLVFGLHPAGITHSPCSYVQCEKQQLDEYVDRRNCSPVSGMLGSATSTVNLLSIYFVSRCGPNLDHYRGCFKANMV